MPFRSISSATRLRISACSVAGRLLKISDQTRVRLGKMLTLVHWKTRSRPRALCTAA